MDSAKRNSWAFRIGFTRIHSHFRKKTNLYDLLSEMSSFRRRQTNEKEKKKKIPDVVMKIKHLNQGFSLIHLIGKLSQHKFKVKFPGIQFRLEVPIRNKILNYGKTVDNLDCKYWRKLLTETTQPSSSSSSSSASTTLDPTLFTYLQMLRISFGMYARDRTYSDRRLNYFSSRPETQDLIFPYGPQPDGLKSSKTSNPWRFARMLK